MKYLSLILFSFIILSSCDGNTPSEFENVAKGEVKQAVQANVLSSAAAAEYALDYEKVDQILSDISDEINQPNILKSDVLRGWYIGSESEKKYGTPDTWIHIDDGENSKWISPNMLEEESMTDVRQLCKGTAGVYFVSCLETSDAECEYVGESYCECSAGSRWKDEQGCIQITERGSLVSINNEELNRGWYFGLPNQKKLNTPANWVWVEEGRKSVWRIPN